jgi:anaerobic magnesium-protoporphyrin IX monomethyl ester cyclase
VVDEIEYDYKLFPYLKEIMFETDTFSASSQHVREICEEILKRNIKFYWSCNTRVDMDLSLLPLMKKAGCRMLMTGFEFGTQEALDSVKKGIALQGSRKFAEAAHKLGFIIHACFMFGAPGETKNSCRKTIEFAKSLPLDTIQFSGICTYPGTELYEWVKKEGYLVPRDWTGWVDERFEQTALVSYPQLTSEDINNFIDIGLKEFYLRPEQIFNMVLNIRSFSDIKRKIYGLKQFINYFFQKNKQIYTCDKVINR